jgi:hypothetical protein
MKTRPSATEGPRVRAASSPGGLARQFRVQYQSAGSANWRVFGSFRHRQDAETAMKSLQSEGYRSRLVEFRFCPAAG